MDFVSSCQGIGWWDQLFSELAQNGYVRLVHNGELPDHPPCFTRIYFVDTYSDHKVKFKFWYDYREDDKKRPENSDKNHDDTHRNQAILSFTLTGLIMVLQKLIKFLASGKHFDIDIRSVGVRIIRDDQGIRVIEKANEITV